MADIHDLASEQDKDTFIIPASSTFGKTPVRVPITKRIGVFCIHQTVIRRSPPVLSPEKYTVTHIPSGQAILHGTSEIVAEELIQALEALPMNWETAQSKDDFTPEQNKMAIDTICRYQLESRHQ